MQMGDGGHHGHGRGARHAHAATPAVSLLTVSVGGRLFGVLVILALLWSAVYAVIQG
jgi:hypothetical protein